MKKVIFYCSMFMLLVNTGYAQVRQVTGTVTDHNGKPLFGATAEVVESHKGTSTNENGVFFIQVETGQTLRFSYYGLKTITLKVGDEDKNIQIQFIENTTTLNEVVVTGYQKERKKDITGAVAVVNVSEIKDIPVGNPIKALQGRVPGVYINTDGSPNGGATVRIRGIGTLGNNDPLYVIDGIPTKRGLEEINQSDIESIQVLKDASSATIYGSRAANGVIIVTTKKARKGYSKINFDASSSFQFYNSKIKVLNTIERGKAYWQAAVNDQLDPNVNQTYQYDWNKDFNNPVLNNVILPEFLDAAKTMRPANTNWFDEVSQTSLIQSYNLSLANGSEKGNSVFSLSYYDNKGVIKESRDKKITARMNTDYSFFKNKLKVGENFSVTYRTDVLLDTRDITNLAIIEEPAVPVYTIDGGWGGPGPGMADRHNPARLIGDNKQNKNKFARVFGNAFAELNIIPNLNFRSSFGIDYSGNNGRTLRKSYVSGFLSDPNNSVGTYSDTEGNWIIQNTLTYNLQKGKSKLDFLLGHEQIKFTSEGYSANREGLALENIDYAYLDAGSTKKDNTGSGGGYSLLSFFGKANYSFSDKYLAALTLRRDGSSRFGKDNRFGYFPALSLGWRLSEEKFIKDAVPAISDLKLRLSLGQTGNQEIANYATYRLYSAIYGIYHIFSYDTGTAYDINGNGSGQLPSGYVLLQQENNALKWETTTEANAGLDFGLLDDKLSGSIDYFNKKTSGILINPAYLAAIGEGGSKFQNGASMQNTGLELLLSYNGKVRNDLSFTVTGNVGTYRNKVTKLPTEVLTSYAGNGTDQTILGRSINSIYGYVADGLFTSQAMVDNSPAQPGKGLGRIKYMDLNGDNIINNKDQKFIGTSDPDFVYGLNTSFLYKNLDMNFFLQGVQGITVYNTYKNLTDFSSIQPGANWGTRTLDAWTPRNSNSSIPALTTVDANNEQRTSTYLIENGSYLKLRNMQIGYNLKNAFKNKVQNARIFIQGSNIFTLKSKSYSSTDPENPYNNYPIPFITTMGINITL
jgi:TonB-linked SusC/RagA family outer membrane protein